MASIVLSEKRGGHSYEKDYTSDCKFGCGCWMGGFNSGGPDGLNPFGKCPKNPKNNQKKTEGKKKVKLASLSHEDLVSNYTSVVRLLWGEKVAGTIKNAGASPIYQRELAMKRELLRRLKQSRESDDSVFKFAGGNRLQQKSINRAT